MAERITLVLDLESGDFEKPFGELVKEAQKKGKKSGKSFGKGFSDGVKSVATSIAGITKTAALAAGALGAVFTAKSIQLANEQENAINRLNTALKVNGDFSQEASQDFQNFASELQKTTKFGDEAILNNLALAKSFGATNEQAKQIATTAADLAEALNIDLESATRNVAKTLGGFAGELGETIPALKNLNAEQLKAGEGIRVLADQFGGTAQQRVKTFSGGLSQLSNTFGDLLEEFGFLITKSPAVTATIGKLNEIFTASIAKVKEFAGSFNFTQDIIFPILNIAKALSETALPAIELFGNLFSLTIANVKTALTGLGFAIGSVIGIFTDKFETETESLFNSLNESAAESKQAFTSILDFPISEQAGQRLAEIEQFYTDVEARAMLNNQNMQGMTDKNREIATENIKTFAEFSSGIFSEFDMKIEKTNKGIRAQIAETNKSVVEFSKKTATALKQGVGTAAGNAFAAFGAALVQGENALEAFGKAFVKQIANVAVQQGTSFILQGIGYLFVPGFQSLGSSLIAAGAGLAAFGGALGAAVSSPSTSGGGAGGSAGVDTADIGTAQTTAFAQDTATAAPDEVREERANVSLLVQGDVLDSEETGTRLAGILSEAFNKQGIVLDEAGVA